MDNSGLSRLSHPKDYILSISEHPNVMIHPLNADLRFIYMDERTLQNALDRQFLRCRIIHSKVFNEVDQSAFTRSLIKEILHLFNDDPIWKAENDSLIDYPCLKGMSEQLIPKLRNLRWRIMLTALLTIALCPLVLRNRLSTSVFREVKIDDEFLSHLI